MNSDLIKTTADERRDYLAQSKQMLDLSLTFFEKVLANKQDMGEATLLTFRISKEEAEALTFSYCHFRLSDARLSALCTAFVHTLSTDGITNCAVMYFAHAAYHCIYDTDIPRFDEA